MVESALHANWSRPYRVVQWATGNVGARAMRRVIEHPGMELVGVWVHSADKAGKDAGELAGVAPIGVKATNSIEDVIALKPDCVLYMPHVNQVSEVCRLLAAGINIVSTRGEYLNPASLDPADRAAVDEACGKGNSSIHATGSNPGFLSEALPILMTSMSRRIDRLVFTEYADTSGRNSPEMLFGPMMGFAAKPGTLNAGMMEHMKHSFAPSLAIVADAIGLPFDEVTASGAQGLARKDTQIAAGLVPAGTVAATRTSISCLRAGKPLIDFETVWYVSADIETSDGTDWGIAGTGWRLQMIGDTPLDVLVRFPVAQEDQGAVMPNYTAHRPVNCIPYVCAAAPGFVTTADMPQVIARFS